MARKPRRPRGPEPRELTLADMRANGVTDAEIRQELNIAGMIIRSLIDVGDWARRGAAGLVLVRNRGLIADLAPDQSAHHAFRVEHTNIFDGEKVAYLIPAYVCVTQGGVEGAMNAIVSQSGQIVPDMRTAIRAYPDGDTSPKSPVAVFAVFKNDPLIN